VNGALYAGLAWGAGKFAQRFGYFTALKLGFSAMLGGLGLGLCVNSAPGHILSMAIATAGMCLTWPTLEALVSEGETRAGLQHMLGIYNVVWAATAAVSNFTGGAMLEKFGLASLFYVPIGIEAVQLALTFWLAAQARRAQGEPPGEQVSDLLVEGPSLASLEDDAPSGRAGVSPVPLPTSKKFLRMAWLANPFAYIAINTLVAVIPGLARRLELSTMLAGFCCSVWCFARLAAFLTLWLWAGWHYRFRWLLAAYLGLMATFMAILTVPSLMVLVLAQVGFGAAVGLTYYSSLFYSMDVGETKGEHGGFHEAAIGLGNFAGPAVGAASLFCLPQYANSGAWGVSALLALGLAGLIVLWRLGGSAPPERESKRRSKAAPVLDATEG
jgi:MFS family permease